MLLFINNLSSNIKQKARFDGNKMRIWEIKKRTILTPLGYGMLFLH